MVGTDRVTVVPTTAVTKVAGPMPAPVTSCPVAMPAADATVRPVVLAWTGSGDPADAGEKVTGEKLSAAVVGCDSVMVAQATLVTETPVTVVFAAIPVPEMDCPIEMPIADETSRRCTCRRSWRSSTPGRQRARN